MPERSTSLHSGLALPRYCSQDSPGPVVSRVSYRFYPYPQVKPNREKRHGLVARRAVAKRWVRREKVDWPWCRKPEDRNGKQQ